MNNLPFQQHKIKQAAAENIAKDNKYVTHQPKLLFRPVHARVQMQLRFIV